MDDIDSTGTGPSGAVVPTESVAWPATCTTIRLVAIGNRICGQQRHKKRELQNWRFAIVLSICYG